MEKLSKRRLSFNADMIDDWCLGCRDAESDEEIAILRRSIVLTLDALENAWREVNTDASRFTTTFKERCQTCFKDDEERGGVLSTEYSCGIRANLPQSGQEAWGRNLC